MSSEIAIQVKDLSKCYQIYDQPRDRLKQFILPRVQRIFHAQARKYYRDFWALRGVSFEVKKGETVGIVGRNGSGKSTLLQLICGVLNPTSGLIQTNGRIAALLELGSGFNPEFTGRENVYLNGAVLGLSRSEIDSKFEDIAAFADIGQFINQPVKTYSSGMVVRLGFSVAINVEPDILIVDEALAVGDELFQRKCFSRIESLRENGATIIFVSHSGRQVIELCDRALLVDAGEKLAEGVPKKIVAYYHRLLHASPEAQEKIRDQLLTFGYVPEESVKSGGENQLSEPKSLDVVSDYFAPELKSESSVTYEGNGATVENISVNTLDGRRVNNIVRGRRYRYMYRVSFSRNAVNVRFGMSIRTVSGFQIAGAFSALGLKECISQVYSGEVKQVEFEFDANLNPGVYFTNAGAYSITDDGEEVLHRIVDAIAFRVVADQPDAVVGSVWLAIESNVN